MKITICGLTVAACLLAGHAFAQVKEVTEAYLPAKSSRSTQQVQQVDDALPILGMQKPIWDIKVEDVHLANTFARWAKAANWQFRWDAGKHIFVEAPGRIEGSFEEALAVVLESPGISQGAYPLEVCFYPNTPPLARVTRRGQQEMECK